MFIRRLDETDYLEYKTIRLEGLMKAPSSFGSSFEEENLFGDDIWKNRLENKNAITLGAFVDEKLVGVVTLLLNERIKTKTERKKGNGGIAFIVVALVIVTAGLAFILSQ